VFIGFTGFTVVMPFLPIYIHDLGVRDVGEIAFWAGMSLGATPAVTAVLSPFWGRLADRMGRKIMVVRSLGSCVVVFAAMAYVTEAWHVFALRLVQGLFAGYGPLALAMAADSSPPDRVASSIGMVQTAQRLGPALGPVIGGAIAQTVGLRGAFLASAFFYLIGFLLVLIFYREVQPASRTSEGGAGTGGSPRPARVPFRRMLAIEHFPLLMLVVFGLQFADRSFGPILPLQLAATGVPLARVPFVSGLMFSLAAGTGALGNTVCGALLRRAAPRTIIAFGTGGAGLAAIAFVFVPHLGALYLAAALFGVSIGVAQTAAYTAGSHATPPEARGAGFGLLSSAYLTGIAVSPIVAGLLGRASIAAVFVCDAVILTALAAVVSRRMRVSPAGAATAGAGPG
jgi:MFS family permease